MITIISIIINITLILFLWILLVSSQKVKTDEEIYLEDILQMEYLKNYRIKHCKKYIIWYNYKKLYTENFNGRKRKVYERGLKRG